VQPVGTACDVRLLNTADPQPAGRMYGLHIFDPQTDRVMTERVCVGQSRV